MDKITLTGKPASTQTIYANTGNRRYMTARGKKIKEQYQWEAKSQWRKKVRTGDVAVDVVLYFPTKTRRDIDNFFKLALDALEGIVYEDDKQIVSMNVEKTYDKDNPRIEIFIH